jgi:DNA-binding NtrC family response regulator
MADRSKILLVEDTPALARTYCGYLRNEPVDIEHVETGQAALDALQRNVPDAMLLDLKLPDMNGLDILENLTPELRACPVIVITAHGSVNTAVEAMQAGAADFLVKPFNAERLKVTLRNQLEKRELTEIVKTFEETTSRPEFEGFLGSSLIMQSVYHAIQSAAASDATVFITGESGTGKEVCAAAVHNRSKRRNGPFVPINCAAIPADLIESEIFGHVKGAFTGAVANRKGAAETADGGTLFLDEICEMDVSLQSKLLRFVQTGSFTKVGSSTPQNVDIRIICATNRDPLTEVQAGRFQEDLYYRLHVIPLALPPLRERGDDVLEIGRHYLTAYADQESKKFTDFDAEGVAALLAYGWPGNVRELQNVIHQTVVMHDADTVAASMLTLPNGGPPAGRSAASDTVDRSQSENATRSAPGGAGLEELAKTIRPLDDVERETITRAIRLCGGDVRKAAVFLGIAPATVYRKLKKWELDEH